MTGDQAIELVRQALLMAVLLATPVIIAAGLCGLVTGAFQTVTQIQDQTLSILPRLIVVLIVVALVMPWGIERLVEYSSELYRAIPGQL